MSWASDPRVKFASVDREAFRNAIEKEGKTSIQIAKEFNCSKGAVYYWIRRLGIRQPKRFYGKNRILVAQGLYRCGKCGNEKSLTKDHYQLSKTGVPISGCCIPCRTSYQKSYNHTLNGKLRDILRQARGRAVKSGMDFKINITDMQAMWTKQQERCFYTNLQMGFAPKGHPDPKSRLRAQADPK